MRETTSGLAPRLDCGSNVAGPGLCSPRRAGIDHRKGLSMNIRSMHSEDAAEWLAVLKRLEKEIKRRMPVAGIFPDDASRPRLVRALASEIQQDWTEGTGCCFFSHDGSGTFLGERLRRAGARRAADNGPAFFTGA